MLLLIPMNDIDTIREALERAYKYAPHTADGILYWTALAALERVSALQAEMEAALDQLKIETLGWNPKKPTNRPMTNVERIFAKLETKR